MEDGDTHDTPPARRRRAGLRSGMFAAGAAFGLTLGALGIATAQSDSPTTTTPSTPGAATAPDGPRHERHRHVGARLSVAAEAIGIEESELATALRSGQSIAQVAQSKNVDVQKVIDALVADARAHLAEAVKAGDLTQAQADAKSANLVERVTEMVNHTGLPGHHRGPGHGPGHAKGVHLSVAAEAIGIEESELATALRSGQSIAQVAQSKNVDVQKVIDALVAEARTRLAEAVKAGDPTQAQADAKSANLVERVTELVNRTGLPGHHRGPGGPGGPGHAKGARLSVAAEAIGIEESELATALRSGQSIAQVAQSKNVDVQKVIDALVAEARTRLAEAVKAGDLTQAQADAKSANLVERVTELVNHTGLPGHHRGPGGPGRSFAPDAPAEGTPS